MTPPELTVVPDVEEELDRLYGLPLNEFTAARNDLAKRLRKAGDRDGAENVAGRRRPSVTAWAINQAARRAPEQAAAVVECGRELFGAQQAALGGETGDRFAAAQQKQRDAIRALVRTARSILGEAGHSASDQSAERIASTLRAASVDPAGQQLLERGRFDDDFEGAGMSLLAGLTPPKARPLPRKSERARAPARAAASRRSDDVAAARAAVRDAKAAERELRRNADRVARDAERAREAAHRALAAAEHEAERAAAARVDAAAAAEAVAEAERRLAQLGH